MKVGILGPVNISVKINLDDEFDQKGIAEGHAVISYNSSCLELAKKLSNDNEVRFLTSFDRKLEDDFRKMMKNYNIDTKYCSSQPYGTGFEINFINGNHIPSNEWYPDLSRTLDLLKSNESKILDDLDVMVIALMDEDTLEDIINLCRKHQVHVFILAEDSDLNRLDDSGVRLIRRVKVIYPNDAVTVLSDWGKLTKEERTMAYTYEDLLGRWENIQENIDTDCDYEELKHLIFDTYHYYRQRLADAETLPRKDLLLYKYVCQIEYYFSWYGGGIEAETFSDVLHGLCYVVEETFDTGYGQYPLPLGASRHTPDGGSDPEADMTTFESFEKSFDDNVKMLQEEYED